MSKLRRGSRVTLLALALSGCAPQVPPFDPRSFQQEERDSASEVLPRKKQPLPTTLQSEFLPATGERRPATTRAVPPPATGPALGLEHTIRMPLQEMVQRAVASSLDVKVQGYGPAIEATRVVEAVAQFDPTFFVSGQFEERNPPPGTFSSTASGSVRQSDAKIWNARSGLRQNLEGGGQIEARYDVSRVSSAPDFFSGLPEVFYQNELVLQLTQPLLRNFGTEVNRARIRIARNNQRVSLLDFREALEEAVAEIERLYWQLVQAEREVQIAENLLDRTVRTAAILRDRMGQDVTRVQLSQANASVETRRVALIRARARVRDLSDEIKRRMNDPDMPVTGGTLLLPATAPIEQPITFTLDDLIDAAYENRFELGQQTLRINNATIAARFARNQLLPQLNAVGSVAAGGLGDSLSDGFENQGEFNQLSYAIGLQFEVPFGNRAARAVWRRAQLQRQQAVTQYQALLEQVALDVKTALREVETSWEEMVGTRQAVFAAADALLAVQQREEAQEPLTPEFVDRKLELQRQLAEAERTAAAAVSSYNFALSRLERAKGTLLRYNNVVMEENEGMALQ